ncbi:MAG TPA: hypothetical protein VGK29_03120 [Paludibaculum sp.]|jgi:hypothetical protein
MKEENNTGIAGVHAFLRGEPIVVGEQLVKVALQRYPLRSTSRRGFIIVIGDWLVRLSDDDAGRWTVQRLPQSAGVARELLHEHVLRAVRLPDGWDVLECAACGMEW